MPIDWYNNQNTNSMGIFDKWILARAKRIETERNEQQAAEQQKYYCEYAERLKIRAAAREQINTALEAEISEFKKTPHHLEIGKPAILNVYSLSRDGYNGWDGGPSSLIQHCKFIDEPIVVTILEVYVDTSLTHEMADRFLDADHSVAMKHWVEQGSAGRMFIDWLKLQRKTRIYHGFGNDVCLYWTAKFETSPSLNFQPKWGLNVDSFISQGEAQFNETWKVWRDEIELTHLISKKKDELDAVRRDLAKLQENYRNIVIK